jgi:prevent-host-death family protein
MWDQLAQRISARKARAELAQLLNSVSYGGKRWILCRHGRPVAALVGLQDFQVLLAHDEPADSSPSPHEPRVEHISEPYSSDEVSRRAARERDRELHARFAKLPRLP